MKLEEYKPLTEAKLKTTEIKRAKYPIFDIHTHMGKLLLGDDYDKRYDTADYVNKLREKNIVKAVNLDGFYGAELVKMKNKIGEYSGFFINFLWIDHENLEEDYLRKLITDAYEKGCRGIKIWKNLTLDYGIRTDDERLDVVYEMAADLNIPVLMHIGDPTAFFKPLANTNERYEELAANPDWQFADHSHFPSFEELMEMQENTIARHPNTTFIIAHFGSYSENLEQVGKWLDAYPNMHIDIAARIAELGRVPYSARRFFYKYSKRILFGSDCGPLSLGFYEYMFRFLESDDEYFPYDVELGQGRWHIYGLYLGDEVLKDVYYKNACRLLHIDEEEFLKG